MSRNIGPCMCGALDCRSCGPAQGYSLEGEDAEHGDDRDEDAERGLATLESDGFDLDDGPDERAADRYQRDIEARHP